MSSWWDFGEHVGFSGNKLALYKIACAFCNEKGNFSTSRLIQLNRRV
jgi:hypothetical protein